MNEYTVLYLNGIIAYIMATNDRDIEIEAELHARRNNFACKIIKTILDEDGNTIKTNKLCPILS